MTPQNYLRSLRAQLKGFSAQEQDDLLEEISTHFESGENDPELGKDPQQRRQKVLAEMGSTRQLGNGFRDVHRPGRLVDYLLILIPTLLIYILLRVFLGRGMVDQAEVFIRIPFWYSLFCILMLFISFLRRSLYLKLYWMVILGLWAAQLPGLIFYDYFQNNQKTVFSFFLKPGVPTMTFSFSRLAAWAEWIVPTLLLLTLLWFIGRTIRHVRFDLLTVAYAGLLTLWGIWTYFQPMAETGVSTWFQHYFGTYAYEAGSLIFARGMFIVPWSILAALGLFFLVDKRDLRWVALAFYSCAAGVSDLFLIKISVFWIFILVNEVLFPAAIVLTAWYFETRRKALWQYNTSTHIG